MERFYPREFLEALSTATCGVCGCTGKMMYNDSIEGLTFKCGNCGSVFDEAGFTSIEEEKSVNERMEKLKVERRDLFDRYQALKMLVTSDRRSKFLNFCEWVEQKTDYIGSPASSKYHLAEPYGLLEHSLNVAENAIKIKNVLAPEITDESCVICGLFHDLGKAGHPGKPKYIKNEPTEKQKKAGYGPSQPYRYTDDEGIILTVPQQALFYVTKGIQLTLEEYQAILIHDGQYVPENKPYACKEEPFSLILHYADSWSGFVVESRVL